MTRLKEVSLAILHVFCVQVSCEYSQDRSGAWYSAFNHVPRRMIVMMRSYYDSGAERIRHLNNKRFEFENTKEFEEGYIMGEIIERYRMMVEHVHAMEKFKYHDYMDSLLRMEQIQQIYFEVYHLVNMMYELPRKYGEVSKDSPNQVDSHELPPSIDEVNRLLGNAKQSRQSKKKLREHLKKLRIQKDIDTLRAEWTTFVSKKRPSQWPLEYGWEIEYW